LNKQIDEKGSEFKSQLKDLSQDQEGKGSIKKELKGHIDEMKIY